MSYRQLGDKGFNWLLFKYLDRPFCLQTDDMYTYMYNTMNRQISIKHVVIGKQSSRTSLIVLISTLNISVNMKELVWIMVWINMV